MLRRTFATLILIAIACLTVSLSSASAFKIGSECSGNSFTWTGEGDGHSWSDPGNWNPEEEAPPKAEDSATIEGSESEEAEVEGGSEICDLTVEGPDAFLTNTNMTISGDLTWEGGGEMEAASELEGTFTVAGTTKLSHNLSLSAGKLTSNGELEVEAGTALTMGDEADVISNGVAEIGGGIGGILGKDTVIQSNQASESNDNSKLVVNGSLSLDGDVESPQLDLNLGAHGSVDLDGNTWKLPGLSYSRWKSGSQVKSSSSGGVLAFSNLAELLVDGSVEIGKDALVSMRENSMLTDGKHAFEHEPAGSEGLLRGEGTLEWQSGDFEGKLTLAPSFHTVLDDEGASESEHRLIAQEGTVLRNEGTIDDQRGQLIVDGTPDRIENLGTVQVHAGAQLKCNSSECKLAFDNSPLGTLEVLPAISGTKTSVPVHEMGILDGGLIHIPKNLSLHVEGDGTVSFADGATLAGGGTLELGEEGKANVTGTTTLRDGTVLSVDGNEAELHGGVVNAEGDLFPGILNAAHEGDGTLKWTEGSIGGSLLTDNQLLTQAGGAPSTSRYIVEDESDPHEPSRDPTELTLASPTQISGFVYIDSDQNHGTAVRVSGLTTITGPKAGFLEGGSDSDGVMIDLPGSIDIAGPGVDIDAPLQVLGTLSFAGPTAALDVPGGYVQEGPNAKTILNGATLSTDNGSESFQTISLEGGSLTGPGTVKGSLEVSGATVSPSADGSTPGTLNVKGNYLQRLAGTLDIHVAGTGASEHDKLAISETSTLAGHLVATTNPGYAPSAPTSVPDVLSAAARTGTFSTVSSPGAPAHTAWSAVYNSSNGVDLLLGSTGSEGSTSTPPPTTTTGSTKPPAPAPELTSGKTHVSATKVKLLPHGKLSVSLHNANGFVVQLRSLKLIAELPQGKHRKRLVTLASTSSHKTLRARHTETITLKLSSAAAKALRSHRHPKVDVNALLSAPDGSSATTKQTLTLA